jgi:hypothetical protein
MPACRSELEDSFRQETVERNHMRLGHLTQYSRKKPKIAEVADRDLWLSRHVHICVTGSQVVLLDLRRDEYTAYDSDSVSPLATIVSGWPATSGSWSTVKVAKDDPVVGELLSTEILTSDEGNGKDAQPIRIPRVMEEILEPRSVFSDITKPRYPLSLRHRVAFFVAVTRASVRSRTLTLETLVARTRSLRRGQQVLQPTSDASPPSALITHDSLYPNGASAHEYERLRKLTAHFRWLRPWGYAVRDRCLFDSLVLIEYLAQFSLHPMWVFGVKTDPFAAHSWVQAGSTVLNDNVNHVREYTPIMYV